MFPLKKLFEEVKSYKNEIEFLNDQIWTNKAEQKYQVFELENKLKAILNEREELIDRLKEQSRFSYADEKSLQYASDNETDMTETETQRHFRSSLEVITTKVVNIPIELEQRSISDADQTLETDKKKSSKLASSSKENIKNESVEELKVELLQKEIEKLEKLNTSLQNELKQAETERVKLESKLKSVENENQTLESKYQQKIQFSNEKIEQIQVSE
jgi:chromosome segregation ATPase